MLKDVKELSEKHYSIMLTKDNANMLILGEV